MPLPVLRKPLTVLPRKTGEVDVLLLGGTLTIRYTGDTVLMTGNAVEVFTGTVEV